MELPGEASARKLRFGTSHKKATMLSVFWDEKCVFLIDYADAGVAVNSEYYCTLVRDVRRIRRKSRVYDLYYLSDNAPIHTSALSTTTVDSLGLTVLPQPPYSPNLALLIIFCSDT